MVKFRRKLCIFDRLLPSRISPAGLSRLNKFLGCVRKQSVRRSCHVLNSPRINTLRGKTVDRNSFERSLP